VFMKSGREKKGVRSKSCCPKNWWTIPEVENQHEVEDGSGPISLLGVTTGNPTFSPSIITDFPRTDETTYQERPARCTRTIVASSTVPT
jgi:hypothetical protein